MFLNLDGDVSRNENYCAGVEGVREVLKYVESWLIIVIS